MITIYELKRRNRANGGQFFNRETLKYWGDTLKNFRIKRHVDPNFVVVERKNKKTSWVFDVKTGRFQTWQTA